MEKDQPFAEIDGIQAEFKAFCEEHGYSDDGNPTSRVMELAATFLSLKRAKFKDGWEVYSIGDQCGKRKTCAQRPD